MALNPNCPACRDPVGHFCSEKVRYNATAFACRAADTLCVGPDYSPVLLRADGAHLSCPTTCIQCPGYTDGATMMWTTVRSPLARRSPAARPPLARRSLSHVNSGGGVAA